MARKKPSNIKASGIPEYIAHTDAKGKQTQLETRLGRLVLKLAEHQGLLLGIRKDGKWTVTNLASMWIGDTPIDALLAAGINDE